MPGWSPRHQEPHWAEDTPVPGWRKQLDTYWGPLEQQPLQDCLGGNAPSMFWPEWLAHTATLDRRRNWNGKSPVTYEVCDHSMIWLERTALTEVCFWLQEAATRLRESVCSYEVVWGEWIGSGSGKGLVCVSCSMDKHRAWPRSRVNPCTLNIKDEIWTDKVNGTRSLSNEGSRIGSPRDFFSSPEAQKAKNQRFPPFTHLPCPEPDQEGLCLRLQWDCQEGLEWGEGQAWKIKIMWYTRFGAG